MKYENYLAGVFGVYFIIDYQTVIERQAILFFLFLFFFFFLIIIFNLISTDCPLNIEYGMGVPHLR